MLLNLRTLQHGHEHLEVRYEASRFTPDPEAYIVVAPVALTFDVDREEGARYRLAGHVATTLELTCGRCLEPFTLPVDAVFDLRYLPRVQNQGEGELEIAEDDLSTAFYADDTIDLGQLMSEQFHLALPMKPLCSDACRGLCPECGVNLNVTPCKCTPKWEDPRLAALKTLLKGD